MAKRHIVNPREETKYFCGRERNFYDFVFTDPSHVVASIEANSLVEPCKRCTKAIIKILERA